MPRPAAGGTYADVVGLAVLVVSSAMLVLVAAVVLRRRVGALPPSTVVEYLPLPGASVVDDAILAGREQVAVAAGLIDLVVRGRVRLLTEEGVDRSALAMQIVDADALTADDRRLLRVVAGTATPSGASRRLPGLHPGTAVRVRAFVDARARRLRRAGLTAGRTPWRGVVRWSAVAVLVLAVLSALVTPVPVVLVLSAVAAVLAAAGLVVVPAGSARRFTPAAAARRTHLAGLRAYMRVGDAARLRALQSPAGSLTPAGADVSRFVLNERLLPYAIVFGIEKAWLRTLRLEFDEMGETSRDALTVTGDGLAQALDVLVTAGAQRVVASVAGRIVDAVGDGLDLLP